MKLTSFINGDGAGVTTVLLTCLSTVVLENKSIVGLYEGITEIELSVVELNDKPAAGIFEGKADACSMFGLSVRGIVIALSVSVLLYSFDNKHIDLYDISIEQEELICTLPEHNRTKRKTIGRCRQLIYLLETISKRKRDWSDEIIDESRGSKNREKNRNFLFGK